MTVLRQRIAAVAALVFLTTLAGCHASTGQVTITTTTLPDGVVNQSYSQQLMGTHVNSWFVVDSTLPPGLQLSTGVLLSGTPTQAGSFTFTVEADQSSSYGSPSVDQTLTLVIAPA